MCECAGDYLSDELYYPQQSSRYPQTYPQRVLPENQRCGMLSTQVTEQVGDTTEDVNSNAASLVSDVDFGLVVILRQTHLRDIYAQMTPEFRLTDVCGR